MREENIVVARVTLHNMKQDDMMRRTAASVFVFEARQVFAGLLSNALAVTQTSTTWKRYCVMYL